MSNPHISVGHLVKAPYYLLDTSCSAGHVSVLLVQIETTGRKYLGQNSSLGESCTV